MLDVNLSGVGNACRAVVLAMRPQRRGAIVAISSINALVGFRGMAAYDASKAAVLALVRHVATEYGADGIRANAVCPGPTITDFHRRNAQTQGIDGSELRQRMLACGLLGRAAEPADIAAAVAFLISDYSAFITGQTLVVDGGYTVAGARL